MKFAFFDTKRNAWIVEEGTYRFMIGDSVENILLEEELSVAGETDVHADLKKEYLQTGPEGLYVSDRDFETVLGREIPSVAKILPVGRNTAIADLEDTRIGRYVHRAVKHLLKNIVRGRKLKAKVVAKHLIQNEPPYCKAVIHS